MIQELGILSQLSAPDLNLAKQALFQELGPMEPGLMRVSTKSFGRQFNLFRPTSFAQIMLNESIQLHSPPKLGTKNFKIIFSKHFVDTLKDGDADKDKKPIIGLRCVSLPNN